MSYVIRHHKKDGGIDVERVSFSADGSRVVEKLESHSALPPREAVAWIRCESCSVTPREVARHEQQRASEGVDCRYDRDGTLWFKGVKNRDKFIRRHNLRDLK